MTCEEAIKYAKKVNFCCGCPIDMANCDGDECGECEHRAFFDMAIEALKLASHVCEGCMWKDVKDSKRCVNCQRLLLDHYERRP